MSPTVDITGSGQGLAYRESSSIVAGLPSVRSQAGDVCFRRGARNLPPTAAGLDPLFSKSAHPVPEWEDPLLRVLWAARVL